MNNLQFNEWLENRDPELYSEVDWRGLAEKGGKLGMAGARMGGKLGMAGAGLAKKGWDGASDKVRRTAKQAALGGAIGVAALGGFSGDPGIDLVSKHTNMPAAQVQQMKETDPTQYQDLLQKSQTDKTVHGLHQSFNKEMGTDSPEPEDGYNWQAPRTHYQNPYFSADDAKKTQPKAPTTQSTIDRINNVLGDR
jgi:hypothetical protein